MVFKYKDFRKHVEMCWVFLTLFTILTLTVCISILFFMSNDKKEISAKEIFHTTIGGIVEVKAYTEDVGESFGTAQFIDNEGLLVTNAHVVTYTKTTVTYEFDKYYIRFATDDDYVEVSLVKYDKDLDIAVLKMDPSIHSFAVLKTSDSSKLSSGDKVYAIGNSANYGLSMAEGIIGAPLINISYNDVTRSVIQANINITEGNSGGALLDDRGNLIGITTFRTRDNKGNVIYGIAYCIPINTVLEYIN